MSSRWGTRVLDLAGLASSVAWIVLAVHSRGTGLPRLGILLGVLAVGWAALATGAGVAGKTSGRAFLYRILVWGLVFRAAGVIAVPIFEDDWHRYLWDGYRLAETGSPYGVPPLEFFDDPTVPAHLTPLLDGINNPDLPTVYGPLTEIAFLAAYLVAPGELWPLKLLLLVCDVAVLAIFWRRAVGPRACLLWFWCPLLIHEGAFNAHPESIGLLLLAAALSAAAAGRLGRVPVYAALACGTRLFAILLAPFLLAIRRRASDLLLFTATLLALYVPFLLQGSSESISVAAMAGGWEFNSSGYALIAMVFGPVHGRLVAGGLFAAVYVWMLAVYVRRVSQPPPGDWIYGLLFLFSPVVNPWYLVWLLPFAVFRPTCWAWTALCTVSLSYVHGMSLGDPALTLYEHPVWLRPLEFGAIAIGLGVDLVRQRSDEHRLAIGVATVDRLRQS